ncbi:uncharacterized protein LOC127853892 isoform X2 [Dreissena polymorpha]|uniref:uncharacterized protein LOC127853892 isoform X2 n=1 Tax=Dreissena polymorpha TaxID=45954 RepID=UPI002265387D|nr:uncharacterized protein LOC127853892 isoform X2 [Dreissena polymorpha]
MLAFFLAIYIGVCCSATPNAENEGCPDLNNHTNWETIGPNIQNIKMLQTGRAGVSCKTGYQAYLYVLKIYSDHFAVICKNGSWDVAGSVCQEKAVACPDPNNTSNETMWQHTQPFNYTRTTTRYTVQCEPGYNALGFNGYHDSIVALCDNDTWTANAVCREIVSKENYQNQTWRRLLLQK